MLTFNVLLTLICTQRGGDCHVATNCNFHQRHLKKAGDGTYFYDPEYFLPKEVVDEVGTRIEKARRRPPRPYRSKVPDAALDQCDDSHTAASANKAKTGDLFDDKGVGALVCCHDVLLFFVNIDTPGEQQKYAVALIDHLLSMLPLKALVVLLYDIGCVLDRSVNLVGHLSYLLLSSQLMYYFLFSTIYFLPPSRNESSSQLLPFMPTVMNGPASLFTTLICELVLG